MINEIFEELIDEIGENIEVKDVIVGAHWTFVQSVFCGMASTVFPNAPHGESQIEHSGELHKKDARELAHLVFSENTLEAGIGLATINSTIKIHAKNTKTINIASLLAEKGAGKNIALIGHFPFIPSLKEIAKNLWVIELTPTADEIPAENAKEFLADADILAITSNTLINHTLDEILDASNKNSLKTMLGPSTPMHPIMYKMGIEIIAGVKITNPALLVQYITQAASFQQIKGAEKIVMRKEP